MKEAFKIAGEIAAQVRAGDTRERCYPLLRTTRSCMLVRSRAIRPPWSATRHLCCGFNAMHCGWQVTAANPAPVTLRLEKIYEPCMLVTKKRYVGFMHESPTQTVPSWDAKVTHRFAS